MSAPRGSRTGASCGRVSGAAACKPRRGDRANADRADVRLEPASWLRRVGALAYEALLLLAMALVAGFLFLPLVSPAAAIHRTLAVPPVFARTMMFCVLVAGAAGYYVWCWSGGRRTLPQKTWRLQLVDRRGSALSRKQALIRYAAAWIGPALALAGYAAMHASGFARNALALAALNYCWVIFDPDRQFLHDRIAGTRVVNETVARAARTEISSRGTMR